MKYKIINTKNIKLNKKRYENESLIIYIIIRILNFYRLYNYHIQL